MEGYFTEIAACLDSSLEDGEMYTCGLEAEVSDFVRMNRGRVRQCGTVAQAYLELHLIRGKRHAQHRLGVSRNPADDREAVLQALRSLRETVRQVPEDPHLRVATDVHSSRVQRTATLPAAEDAFAAVLEAGHGLDLVGFYAAGPIYRGFANSLGQRNWHEARTFNLEWSLYHRADKAVKTAYSGFEWSDAELAARMAGSRERLALLSTPSRTLKPGRYRAYLAPPALDEVATMLCWGGFSGRALQTRQSCLSRMQDGSASLSAAVSFAENTAAGVAPAFQSEGYTRPERVDLVDRGRLVGALVSPRTSREFALAPNGANADEVPESLEMGAGDLPAGDVLAALDTGIYVGNLWYLNFSDRPACRLTGMTRFASFWVERGRIVAPIDVMRFDDSVFRMLGSNLEALTRDRDLIVNSSTYGSRNLVSMRLPGALVGEMSFSL